MTKADYKLSEILSYLMKRYGVDAAYRLISPLEWYVNTGRASVEFLHRFYDAKPFVVARVLCAGGSDQEIVDHLKVKLRG